MAVITENRGDASAYTGTLYTISLGDVFRGTLDPAGDDDWIKVELTAGTAYDFTLSGVDGESAQLTLYDSSGNYIIPGSALPSGAKLVFSPRVTGDYYINAGSYDEVFTGDYELSLVENTIPAGTYDEIAGYLTDGFWDIRRAFDVEPGGVLTADITALNEEGQQLARWALDAWTNVTGIKFEFVDDDNAHITFDHDLPGPDVAGWASSTVNNGIIVSSVVNILVKTGAPVSLYLHEIGHALGLGHPGPYGSADGTDVYGISNIFLNDTEQATVMTYFSQDHIDASFASAVTPMIADIIAIQNLYGVPDSINTGDTIYGYRSNLDGYLGEYFKLWVGEEDPFSGIVPGYSSSPSFSSPRLADLDSDGDPDLVIGYYTGLHYFENTGTPTNPDFTLRTGTDNPLEGISVSTDGKPTLIDLDADGDIDLIVGSYSSNVAYFENTGTASAPNFTPRIGATNPFDNIATDVANTPALADLDGDGDLDLALGRNDGVVDYYENIGTPANANFVRRTGEASPVRDFDAGYGSTPVFVDVDDDNDFDLVVGNTSGNFFYFENTGTTTDAIFTQRTDGDNPFHEFFASFSIAPEFVDINGDDNPDLVVGNQEGIIRYFKNTGTPETPEFSPQHLSTPTTFTIYDNGGNDTLDLRTDTKDQRVDLRPEGISDVYGLTGNAIIARDTWIENFIAGSGNDFITGNAVANDLNGREGNDRIWGSGGDDILEGGAGADHLDGDAGLDWAAYRDSDAAVTVNLAESIVQGGHAEGDVLTEIENVMGSAYDDVLVGNDEANRLEGGAGADRLEGGAGADRLEGGAGTDWASYHASDAAVTVNLAENTVRGGHAEGDVLTGIENVIGSAHDDVLVGNDEANRLEGGAGADRLEGGAGTDWVSYRDSDVAVMVNLAENTVRGGHAEGDVLIEIENVMGSAYDDVLVGNDETNRLHGGAGADRLEGGAGTDWVSYRDSDAAVTVNLAEGIVQGGHAEGDVLTGIENVTGSAYDDVLVGNDEANRLEGGAGIDWVSYRDSDAAVTVNLAEGIVQGGHAEGDVLTGIENVTGSAYDDVLVGNDEANRLEGGAGADRLEGGAGIDWLSYAGSDGAVSVRLYDGYAARGHAEGDVISGFENLRGSHYSDALAGSGRANRLAGGAGDDQLWAGNGDDILEGGAGGDSLDGGAGMDTASYWLSDAGVRVNLAENTAEGGHAGGDTFTGIENVTGSDYRDVLTGDNGANRLDGAEGDDTLHGGSGADRLIGNLGDDLLYGGAGDDELYGNDGDDVLEGGAGADRLDGGPGIDQVSYQNSDIGITVLLGEGTVMGGHAEGDVLIGIEGVVGTNYGDALYGDAGANQLDGNDGPDVLSGGAGADRLDGGAGIDSIVYWSSDAGVTVSLEDGTGKGGHAEGDAITNVEDVQGTGYEDILIGDDSANNLRGFAGDDELHGNDGPDVLNGGAGADRLDGGAGIDSIDYWSSDAGVTVNLEDGTGEGGHAEGDAITNVEYVEGTGYEDILIGDDSANILWGYAGDDELHGNDGPDVLSGGAGADNMYGEVGDDLLTGGAGADRLDGGAGDDQLYGSTWWDAGDGSADVFVFDVGHGNDTIHGFADNEDKIDISAFNLSGFDALSLSYDDEGTTIDLSDHRGGTILLAGFDIANLDATDFLF